MTNIFDFLGEDISQVNLTFNVVDGIFFVQNKLSCGILAYCHVTDSFGGGGLTPVNACIIIVEESCGIRRWDM